MFSPDSKFMQVVGRLTDLIVLNLLFILTCLPVFTIGASITALYSLCFRLMREEYRGVVRTYFQDFRRNFKQATLLWLLLLAAVVPALSYCSLLLKMGGIARYGSILFLIITLIGLMAGSFVFPWISQFENTTVQSLKNALILSVSHLPRTMCILVINLLPVILLLVSPSLFLQISFLWVALYFAAAAYMNTGLLWHVFKPYRT